MEQRRHFLTANIAGFSYWDGCIVFDQLKMGLELTLVREVDNKFDPYAVAIYLGEHKLGFLPRSENKEISKFLEMGHTDLFETRINRLSPDEHTENQVGVIVYVRAKEGMRTLKLQ